MHQLAVIGDWLRGVLGVVERGACYKEATTGGRTSIVRREVANPETERQDKRERERERPRRATSETGG